MRCEICEILVQSLIQVDLGGLALGAGPGNWASGRVLMSRRQDFDAIFGNEQSMLCVKVS